MNCNFILTRGKNKGTECGKKNCKNHADKQQSQPVKQVQDNVPIKQQVQDIVPIKQQVQDIVQLDTIGINANIGKCIHALTLIECDTCKASLTLSQCDICKLSGDINSIIQHVEQFHKILIVSNSMSISYNQIINKCKNRCSKCPMITCTQVVTTDLIKHIDSHYILPKEIQEIQPGKKICSHEYRDNDFCRTCLIKDKKRKTWYCNLCKIDIDGSFLRPHNKLHKKNCLYCNICQRHVNPKCKHLPIYPKCPIPNCIYKFTSDITDDLLYQHLITSHKPIQVCQIDGKSTCNHVKEYQLHNNNHNHNNNTYITRYNIKIDDLFYTTLDYPEKEILKRVDDAINNLTTDSDIFKLPNDVWTIIYPYLNLDSKFKMVLVCKRFKEISSALKSDQDNLRYLLTHIEPDKDKLCATLAKQVFYLTDKNLEDVHCTYHRNPHYRSAASMKMYDKSDLIQMAFEKYKTLDAWIKRKEKRRKLIGQLANIKTKRQEQLRKELENHGLELRYDSRVCDWYITHGCGPNGESLQGVVDIMREMDWYFENTEYEDVFREIIDEYKEDGEWYDINDVSRSAKRRVILEYKRQGLSIDNVPRLVVELYNRV